MAEQSTLAALDRLDAITRRLRRECPWDREQDERSIVPHTVEEAYELADAAASGDDEKLRDELGDVLFQVVFLALLLEERGAGDLADVAATITAKLIRRHPHVFEESEARALLADREGTGESSGAAASAAAGPEAASTGAEPRPAAGDGETVPPGAEPGPGPGPAAGTDSRAGELRNPRSARDVLANWERIKREVEGRGAGDPFADVPENLPALLYARKVLRRIEPGAGAPADRERRDADERRIGEALLETVREARRLGVDPELALRAAARRLQSPNGS